MAIRGNSSNIIVGAAQVFVADDNLEYYAASSQTAGGASVSQAGYYFSQSAVTPSSYPAFVGGTRYADTLEGNANYRNVGYTMNGLELTVTPDFGEVSVDQLLDVAKLYKQGMTVQLKTAFAEATLANLVVAIAASSNDFDDTDPDELVMDIMSGELGSCPLERSIIAVGPGTGDCAATGPDAVERVYVAYRALSIEAVTMTAKRDAPSQYDVTFRLLPTASGAYGRVIDRTVGS
jgi:hypothetical protein